MQHSGAAPVRSDGAQIRRAGARNCSNGSAAAILMCAAGMRVRWRVRTPDEANGIRSDRMVALVGNESESIRWAAIVSVVTRRGLR